MKYPRTKHLPFSPGVSSDDERVLDRPTAREAFTRFMGLDHAAHTVVAAEPVAIETPPLAVPPSIVSIACSCGVVAAFNRTAYSDAALRNVECSVA